MLRNSTEKVLSRLYLFGPALISVIVTSSGVTDPVNVPKLFVLGGIAFSILFVLVSENFADLWRSRKVLFIALILFMCASINSLVFSDAPFSQSFFGVYGRNNGFLLYLCLTFLFLGASLFSKVESMSNFMKSLLIAGGLNLIYCLWVLIFGDFVGWTNPYGNILGTFGNPNFVGAFLGIFSSLLITYLIFYRNNRNRLVLISLALILTIFEIYKSHAVQGVILLCLGLFINIFFFIRSKTSGIFWPTIYTLFVGILGMASVLGTLQMGPLSSILYKYSVTLRGQYWYAGYKMGESHLWSGVGFDSYGDWFRTLRRSSALIHPGVDTVSNTAHNVFLDIFAFGGLPLLVSYIVLIVLVLKSTVVLSRISKSFDPVAVSLISGWVCYQVQSLISINQIGLAIWGWILGGAIISYESIKSRSILSEKSKQILVTKKADRQIFSPQLRGGIGLLLGLLIAFPPLNADMKWRAAQNSRSVQDLESALQPSLMNPASTAKYINSVGAFADSGLREYAIRYSREAIRFNPHSYESWKLLTIIQGIDKSEVQSALKVMRALDPLNPNLQK